MLWLCKCESPSDILPQKEENLKLYISEVLEP